MRSALLLSLLTAAAYYTTGRLGLLLAIPPGYATAVWPPSGLALAVVLLWGNRVWPGILLGSFLVNLGTSSDDGSPEAILRSLAVALAIAGGASLQALAGGALVRRAGAYDNIFAEGIGSLRMLVVGGPASCVISATVGVTTLWLAGLIPEANYLFNWFTWWVGDSLGVLIFTTLVLVWATRPGRQWRRQQVGVTAPMLLMFVAVVALFFFVSQRENARIHARFEELTQRFEQELDKDIGVYRNMLAALTAFHESSETVTAQEFDNFSRRLLGESPKVLALSWNPRVPAVARNRFEAERRALGRPGYRIYELDRTGRRVPATGTEDLYPVEYIAPFERNRGALGFDSGSEAVRRSAIERAIATRQPVATGPISLVQTAGRTGLLIVGPVFDSGGLRGFCALVIDVADTIRAASTFIANTGLTVRVRDATEPGHPLFMYGSEPPGAPGMRKGLEKRSQLRVAGRVWQLDFQVPASYLVAHQSWQAWFLLAAGLLFTALLGIFLLVVIGHAARVEAVVRERTARLNSINTTLQEEVAERARLQRQADLRSQQLSDKNRELERFAYVVSHDLQAPLRSMSGFADLLRQRFAAQLGEEGREFLGFISQGAAQMHRMIRDILDVSRVATGAMAPKPVDLGVVIERASRTLRADIEAARARLSVAPMPVLQADESQMQRLFQNLIDNAIKFRLAGRDPEVSISAAEVPEGWHFEVADNGVGIPADKVERLFNLFSRLHRDEEYPGSGIGLAICKRIVERHRGQIWVTSEPGRGSVFHVLLPAA